MDQAPFYDQLADYYDLIYADWETSMSRHGAAIAEMLQLPSGSSERRRFRILDVASGIGTQALPLAALGCEVVARDLSSASVARLSREAEARGLSIDSAPADMREVGASVEGTFDAIIAFDNAIPHLLSDADIVAAIEGFSRLLRPQGTLLISVRDYREVDRSPTSFHPYGERVRDGRTFRLGQEWTWVDPDHYRTTMIVEERLDEAWRSVVQSQAEYYAVPLVRLVELLEESGLTVKRVDERKFFQPVLRGVKRRGRDQTIRSEGS